MILRSVSDKDAFAMARRLTREEGLFVGGSSGLIAHVALRVARELDDPDAFVVTVLCDTGERYLSKLYNDEWMTREPDARHHSCYADEVLSGKEGDTPPVVGTTPGAPVRQALGLMSLHDISQLPVMDGDNCVGSVSDWSLSQKSLENPKLLDATVSEVMDSPFPNRRREPADRERSEAAFKIESGGTGAQQRNNTGHRDPIGHAALHDEQVGITREGYSIDGRRSRRSGTFHWHREFALCWRSERSGHEVIAFDPSNGRLSEAERAPACDERRGR